MTLAVADACPVSADLSLPPAYDEGVAELKVRAGEASPRGGQGAFIWGGSVASLALPRCFAPRSPRISPPIHAGMGNVSIMEGVSLTGCVLLPCPPPPPLQT